MSKQKESIYIETSVISAYFDFKNQDPERKMTTRKFWQEVLPKFNAVISDTVILELDQKEHYATFFLKLVENMHKLKVGAGEKALAKQYVKARIIRKTQFNDALHLATATLNKIDYLVSLNFQDIVEATQRKKIVEFNKARKLYLTQISTPNDFLIN